MKKLILSILLISTLPALASPSPIIWGNGCAFNLYTNACLGGAGGVGTVVSVGQTVPSFLTISGSPITSTGTLAIGLATQTANTVFSGPTSGSAADPAFRALVSADIPWLTVASNITPSSSATFDLGVTGSRWNNIWGTNLRATTNVISPTYNDEGGLPFLNTASEAAPDGNSYQVNLSGANGTDSVAVKTATNATANATATPAIGLSTGNKTAGTGASGPIRLTTGTSSGGASGDVSFTIATGVTQGSFKFLKTAVPSVIGQVWTASGTDGTGYWATSGGGGGGANTTLSNLGTTAINDDLNLDTGKFLTATAGNLIGASSGQPTRVEVASSSSTQTAVRGGDSNIYVYDDEIDIEPDTSTGAGTLQFLGAQVLLYPGAATAPSLKFYDDNGSNTASIKAPSNVPANYTLTLPSDDGASGEVLSTNGSGVLSWISAGGGSGANTALSNLITTAVNEDLNLDTNKFITSTAGNLIGSTTGQPTRVEVASSTSTQTAVRGGNSNIYVYDNEIDIEADSATGNGILQILGEQVWLYPGAGVAPSLKFYDDNGSNTAAIKAPSNVPANYTLTLPADDGASGEVLSTNGSGVLSWISAGGGGGSPGGADGAIQFNSTGTFGGNTSEFFWDNTTHRMGIHTDTPAEAFEIRGAAGTGGLLMQGSANAFSSVDGGDRLLIDVDPGNTVRYVSSVGIDASWYPAKVKRMTIATNGDLRIFGDTSGYAGFRAPDVGPSSVWTLPTADGSAGQALVTNGSNVLSFASTGPTWHKYTVLYSDLAAAATSNDIELFSLPANGEIEGVIIHHTTAFTGGTASAYTVSVGITGNLTKYASAFDVFQAAANTVNQSSISQELENTGAATSIRVAAISTSDDLDNVTAGSVDIWVKWSTLP